LKKTSKTFTLSVYCIQSRVNEHNFCLKGQLQTQGHWVI